jgi:hypothetical protein
MTARDRTDKGSAGPRRNGKAITLADLATAKRLPMSFLQELGIHDLDGGGVGIPYYDQAGEEIAVKKRTALKATEGSYWPKGQALASYGDWRIDLASRASFLVLVEGESDCWALWHHGIPTLGIPGSNGTKVLTAEQLCCVEKLYVCREPDRGGDIFLQGVAHRLREIGWQGEAFEIRCPKGTKDPADLHLQAPAQDEFCRAFEAVVREAVPLDLKRPGPREGPAAWEQPIPFAEYPRPPFPTHLLSVNCVNYVRALAEFTQTPEDLAGMLVLGVLGAGLARKFRVSPRPGWEEPTNLYAVVALPSGNRKSAVFAEVLAPVKCYEEEELKRLAPQIADEASARRVLEGRLKHTEAKAAKEANPEKRMRLQEEARSLARDLAATKVTAQPQFFADDVTVEKLASLLAEQGGRLLVASPEGTIFEIAKGRYSETPNFDVFLKAHAGDPVRVNRVGRTPDYIDQPALSLAVAVQPDVIVGLMGQTTLRGRGFLARPLYSLPTSLVGKRRVRTASVSEDVTGCFREKMVELWKIPMVQAQGGQPIPYVLRFSSDADLELQRFEEWLEPQLGEGGGLEHLADWGSKLAGVVVRLSGILHVSHAVDSGEAWGAAVEGETVRSAAAIARDYLLPHARAAFGLMGADPHIENAQFLLKWARDNRLTAFARREAHRALGARVTKVEQLDPVLDLLVRHGFIRPEGQPEKDGAGRKSSPRYAVSPLILRDGVP